MPRVPVPFASGFYVSDSLPLSHQQAINCYPQIPQAPALGQETLFPTPGVVELVDNQGITNEVNRGAHVMNGIPYFVNGTTLYRLDRSGSPGSYTYSATDLGTISGSGRVSMADNGSQLCILVPGGDGYILTTASSYGSNIILNGDFYTDTDWTKGTGWTIAWGVATCAANTTAGQISQNPSVTAGKTYKITYDVTVGAGSGSFTIQPAIGGVNGTTVNAAGTYSEEITATTSGGLSFTCTTGSDSVNIDNVVVQEEISATLTQITDPDFTASGNPQYMVFIDGYFVFITDSKKFIVSGLNDGLVYNALDFGSAEADPDDIVCPIVFNNQLFIAGSQTIEAFQNIGGADFPLQRTGVFISKGVTAPLSAVPTNQTFMFIGAGENEGPAVYELAGNGVRKVSTTPIEKVLQDLTDTELSSVFAWTYTQNGGFFVGFVLPDTVLVYDTISQRWHERQSVVSGNTVRWRVNSTVKGYGLILVGDSADGRIGYLDIDTNTEYDTAIRRRFTTPPIHNNMQAFFLPRVELTVESGTGDSTTTDPQITMYLSADGKTWSGGRSRSSGAEGEYEKRVIWRRNGRFPRFVVLRFDMTDPVRYVAIQLFADIEGEDA